MASSTAPATRVAVVGGGPAGALAALILAQRRKDWKIAVYEKSNQSDFDKPRSLAKSWNVVLFGRGQAALKAAGVDLNDQPPGVAVTVGGNVRHKKDGTSALSKMATFRDAVSLERGALARLLHRELQKEPQVSVHFNHELADLDPVASIAKFNVGGDGGGSVSTSEASFDLLIGADGVNSRVRDALEARVPGFEVKQEQDTREFKTFRIADASALPGGEADWGKMFHVWRSPPGEVLCPPGPDGSLTAVIVLPVEGPDSFSALFKSAENVRSFFAEKYPSIFGANGPNSEFCEEFMTSRPGRQRTVYCSRLAVNRVALIGDAAHGMVASLGQGVNAALETSAVLAETLTEGATEGGSEEIPAALRLYDERRRPDAHAACLLSQQGMGAGSARSMSGLAMARIAGVMLLNKAAPMLVDPPALLGISKAEVHYADVLAASKRGARRFQRAAGVAAAAMAARLLWPALRRLPALVLGVGA